MRLKVSSQDLSAHAIVGSYVVTLGFNWPEARVGELQGFALHRTNHSTGRADWLEAQKRYETTDPGIAKGERVSTRFNPVQSFLWADYTVEPGIRYTYRVVARGGTPEELIDLDEVELNVLTTDKTDTGHIIHFNRGAVAAQEYARRFKQAPPEEVPNGAAFKWRSRGLLESVVAFIDNAQKDDELYVAIYEARHSAPLSALKRAKQRGVKLGIIFDAKENGNEAKDEDPFPRSENLDFLEQHDLLENAIYRSASPSYIAHNKFIILCREGAPEAVLTGSTNWSKNGFYGQLNVAHIIWDTEVAGKYLDYWKQLSADPAAAQLRESISSDLPVQWEQGSNVVFSPRFKRDALSRYFEGVAEAQAVFVTLAFSMDVELASALQQESDGLRYVLMDGIKGNKVYREKLENIVGAIRATEAARVAIGEYLRTNALDQFLMERRNSMAEHVQFVHTKFMLIDPLGSNPIVITGSANFSEASSTQNDENMLVISGDADVADIYLGEFMRSYAHYAFRDAVASAHKTGKSFEAKPLNENCTWAQVYYGQGFKSRQRQYFSGS
ncbi:MAG TPA: phospholipase D-like domain-containing protein [Cellvibrionaceae bacterium]|nr:phospholipase D-like domain-containing protein [Cellvibrionaceae bacterium]